MDPFERSTGAARRAGVTAPGQGRTGTEADLIAGTTTVHDPDTDTLCPQSHRTRDGGREKPTGDGGAVGFPFSLLYSAAVISQGRGWAGTTSFPLPKKSLILHKSFCTGWALSEEVDVGLLEGDTAPPGTARSLQLSQTQACTEVYKFSKAFDNVKLLGGEVGGEHTAAM